MPFTQRAHKLLTSFSEERFAHLGSWAPSTDFLPFDPALTMEGIVTVWNYRHFSKLLDCLLHKKGCKLPESMENVERIVRVCQYDHVFI